MSSIAWPTSARPELCGKLLHAALGRVERGQHRLQVAPVLLRDAAVGEKQIEEFLDPGSAVYQLPRWNAEAFLMDVVSAGRDAGRGQAADV